MGRLGRCYEALIGSDFLNAAEEKVLTKLFELKDETYKEFNCKLIPNISKDSVIGVRTPELRKLAKKMFKENEYEDFLSSLPHKYHEEYSIHGMIIEQIKSFDEALFETERLLPFIEDWAICDSFSPKCFKTDKSRLLEKIREWLSSKETYTVRFAMRMLMTHFLDEDFSSEYLKLVFDVHSDEYYIKMMQAWFFATALAKQYEPTLSVLKNNLLDVWVHNKTIQKAVESFRITDEQKAFLKTLRRKY